MQTSFRRILAVGAAVATGLVAQRTSAEPIGALRQATASAGDSRVERVSPQRSHFAALGSRGILTPGQGGNPDGSNEIYRLDLETLGLVQCTVSPGDSTAVKVTVAGDVIVASRENLTPGQEGNIDGGFESWLYRGSTGALRQITSSSEDSFFQAFWDERDRAFFVSRGDLRPAAPGNPAAKNQVFSYDLASDSLVQLTSGDNESLIRAICAEDDCGVIQSSADLVSGGNTDGSREIFLLDLAPSGQTRGFTQVTSSTADTFFRGQAPGGRYLAFESRGDHVPGSPGNADGSQEIFVYDRKLGVLTQATSSSADSFFAGFPHARHLMLIESRGDLTPAGVGGGNADGSCEVYVRDLRAGTTTQITATNADSTVTDAGRLRGRFAVIETTGDLRPDVAGGGTGSTDYYLLSVRGLRRRVGPLFPLVRGIADLQFAGLDQSGRYAGFDTTADLVTSGRVSGNSDGSREVFLSKLRRGSPRLRQVTASTADSEVGLFSNDSRRLLIESRGSLDPTGTGNADGSVEVFVYRYR